ncbi:uncharacterized protein LOC122532007 isoform X2 [Frieseomelitta varia]|uniref:uncharacterized protein LOC122532007 isoform X2 n=1 Tax=Frieseomelitta varia TaxID=561572 RepID=UPI001CB69606|nr:uncharacterized protein LOC122532007 isoform X2 [Frieseomelitta varia]
MDFIGYKYYRLLKFCYFVMGLTSYKPKQLSVAHTTIVCLILLLGSTFFVISRTISHGYRFVMIVNFVIFITSIMFSIKILYSIQCTFDESQKFFYIPYTLEWYNLSLSTQKLLLFIMQGNHHSAVLNLYGIWLPTLETLSTISNGFF